MRGHPSHPLFLAKAGGAVLSQPSPLALFFLIAESWLSSHKRRRIHSSWSALIVEQRGLRFFNIRWAWAQVYRHLSLLTALRGRGVRVACFSSPALAPLSLSITWASWGASFMLWRRLAPLFYLKSPAVSTRPSLVVFFQGDAGFDFACSLSPLYHPQLLRSLRMSNIPLFGVVSFDVEPWANFLTLPFGTASVEGALIAATALAGLLWG